MNLIGNWRAILAIMAYGSCVLGALLADRYGYTGIEAACATASLVLLAWVMWSAWTGALDWTKGRKK